MHNETVSFNYYQDIIESYSLASKKWCLNRPVKDVGDTT